MTAYESVPFTSIHRQVAISGAGGQFADGYSLGVIGIALSLAQAPLGLTSLWIGAVGAATLVGLFLGCLGAGSLSDRFGRRPLYIWGMLIFSVVAALQCSSQTSLELFVWRLLLGVALGADYISCKAIVTEYAPTEKRGIVLSFLAVAWTGGYLTSFIVGYLIRDSGPTAWRVVLLTSAIPSFVTFLLRFGTPESPVWLTRTSQFAKARDILDKHFGPDVVLPMVSEVADIKPGTLGSLFRPPLLRNLAVGCVFHTAQVIPWFALGTFLPIVLVKLRAGDGYTGALIYNILLMLGGFAGMYIVDLISRRTFLIQGFLVMAVSLAVLIFWRSAPPTVTVLLFSAFAFIMSAAGILQFVYPPELFPTDMRARGLGVVTACSRIGSASSTFLLPVIVEQYGVYVALGACMAVCLVAAVVCQLWAPETRLKQIC